MQGRRFDVFLSHHGADDAIVKRIAERLRGEGIQPWLDRWSLTPGGSWQDEIIHGLRACRACARELTSYESVRHFFGAELRRWREQRGLSQHTLCRQINFDASLIGKVEKAE